MTFSIWLMAGLLFWIYSSPLEYASPKQGEGKEKPKQSKRDNLHLHVFYIDITGI